MNSRRSLAAVGLAMALGAAALTATSGVASAGPVPLQGYAPLGAACNTQGHSGFTVVAYHYASAFYGGTGTDAYGVEMGDYLNCKSYKN